MDGFGRGELQVRIGLLSRSKNKVQKKDEGIQPVATVSALVSARLLAEEGKVSISEDCRI